jgi:cystathionine beta-synthase
MPPGNILSRVHQGRATLQDPVKNVMFKADRKGRKFVEINADTPLSSLSNFFDKNSAAIVTERTKPGTTGVDSLKVRHVVTKIDLVSYMMHNLKTQ